MTTKKEVAKKETTELAEYAEGSWGTEDVQNEDIIIPKILVMQSSSDLVKERKAKEGEFRSSLDGALLGGETKPIEFITFHNVKNWAISHNKKFVQSLPVTPENTNWPWEEIDGDTVIERVKSLDFYCLRPEDIASGEPFPYVISFRKTSYNAGKKLATFLAQMRMFKKPSAAQVFSLSTYIDKNDKGTYMVLDVTKSRAATEKELAACWTWYTALKSAAKVKVDESDLGAKSDEAPVKTYAAQGAKTQAAQPSNVVV